MARDGKLYRVECWKQQVWESWCQIFIHWTLFLSFSSPLVLCTHLISTLPPVPSCSCSLCVVYYACAMPRSVLSLSLSSFLLCLFVHYASVSHGKILVHQCSFHPFFLSSKFCATPLEIYGLFYTVEFSFN